MIETTVLVEIMSTKPHKIRKEWYKGLARKSRIKRSISRGLCLLKLRNKNKNKGQLIFYF